VMTSPVVADSLVAIVSASGEAVAWNAVDGREVWNAQLPTGTMMGNPAVSGGVLFIGIEPRSLCAIAVLTGAVRYCRSFSDAYGGAGHASVAVSESLAVMTYYHVGALNHGAAPVRLSQRARRTLEPIWSGASPAVPHEVVVVGVEKNTGRPLWRTSLGIGNHQVAGHVAGTPALINNVAFIPSPYTGAVSALDLGSGRLLRSSDINTARGSVLVTRGAVLAATSDSGFVTLDALTGRVRCRQRLTGVSDRAGPTLAGNTAMLTLRDGTLLARPITDWLQCKA
jgi:outer membrane protein assembly factor BamB